jgi:hypothetical protein
MIPLKKISEYLYQTATGENGVGNNRRERKRERERKKGRSRLME